MDLDGKVLQVRRALTPVGRIESTPKSGESELGVHLPGQAADALRDLQPVMDSTARTPRIFTTGTGRPFTQTFIRKVMARALKRAGLPDHYSRIPCGTPLPAS